jgi:shikimate dehydrogenase
MSIMKETGSISLVVNASSAGMAAQADLSPWPQDTPFPLGVFLYDLVYNPPQTRWILDARRSGLAAVNGIGMLVEQAALAFERWTGHAPSRPAMFQAVSEFGG